MNALDRPGAPITVSLQSTEAHAIDDAEGLFAGDPELYLIVQLNSNAGVQTCTLGPRGTSGTLNGPLGCTITVSSPYPAITGTIQMRDQDGRLGGDDTPLDVTSTAGSTLNTAAIAWIPVKPVLQPTHAFQPFLATSAATPYVTDLFVSSAPMTPTAEATRGAERTSGGPSVALTSGWGLDYAIAGKSSPNFGTNPPALCAAGYAGRSLVV